MPRLSILHQAPRSNLLLRITGCQSGYLSCSYLSVLNSVGVGAVLIRDEDNLKPELIEDVLWQH